MPGRIWFQRGKPGWGKIFFNIDRKGKKIGLYKFIVFLEDFFRRLIEIFRCGHQEMLPFGNFLSRKHLDLGWFWFFTAPCAMGQAWRVMQMGFRWTGDFIGYQIEPNKAKFLENSLQQVSHEASRGSLVGGCWVDVLYAFLDLLLALRNNRATIMNVLRSPDLGVTYLWMTSFP